MPDKLLILDALEHIDMMLQTIGKRAEGEEDFEQLTLSFDGMMKLDAICMNLITLGEMVMGLDKLSAGLLLPKYPHIHWQGIMRMRDKIAHHYFEIDAEVIQQTIIEDIPLLKETIRQMKTDLSK